MKKMNSPVLLALFLLAAAVVCLAQEVGSPPPEFTATDISGAKVTLSQLKGNVVLLDFWATWCPPCRVEVPNLVAIHRQFKDKKFVLLSISLDRDLQAARRFVKDKEMDWRHIIDWDAGREIAGKYQVEYIPSTFVIDRGGMIVATQLRGAELKNKIADLLK
jgi:peroxiredoxin